MAFLTAIPPAAFRLLLQIPREFVDDGCSWAPDRLFGVDLSWACRLHDALYCTRAHTEGALTSHWRRLVDTLLRALVDEALLGHPLRPLVARTYFAAVRLFGGSFNTCGPNAGSRCRHGLTRPAWMTSASADIRQPETAAMGE